MPAAQSGPDRVARSNPEVGLVLAGGGARGAYELGALSVLMPHLERRGERPGIMVGTSIGALNVAHLAATAHLPARESVARGIDHWRTVGYDDLLGPLLSAGELGRLLAYFGELVGVPRARVSSLLDSGPLAATVREIVAFDQLQRNVRAGVVASIAVVATSYATAESVVFHSSRPARSVPRDAKRAIRYVPARLTDAHVHASAAIPVLFEAVAIDKPVAAAGWYGDGGTRLNTPIKPALALGAERVVVIGLNSSALPAAPVTGRPDVFDGAAQFLQAVLADQLAQDVATLAGVNGRVGAAGRSRRPAAAGTTEHVAVPYIFIAPADRLTVGRLAQEVYAKHFSSVRNIVRQRDLAALGHIVDADAGPVRGELFSFLFFAREFVDALIELGRSDAARWLAARHDDGPWRLREPPRAARGAGRRVLVPERD